MKVQRATTRNISAAKRLDAFMDAYTPTVANIARGALARLRRQVPGAIELVGDRYTGLVIGFSPTLMITDWIRNSLEFIRAALYLWALSRLIKFGERLV